jgi:phosphatidylinositol glycan class W
LLANLLTGAVNMCLSTIYMDEVRSMGIMVGYMAVLTGVALGLDWADISIKL